MSARIELVKTSGIFSIDGEDFEVENNIWLLGDDHEVLVIDAAHDAAPIAEAVGDRTVRGIVCTHGHNDHINAADALVARDRRRAGPAAPRRRDAVGRRLSRPLARRCDS